MGKTNNVEVNETEKNMDFNKQLKLVLDRKVLDKYNAYYFCIHKKAKKAPIEKPWHPSINIWCVIPRIQMNALKQKWKDFIVWWINDIGCNGMNIQEYEIEFNIYHPTKRRADPDNFSPKFIMDGFTECNFLVDDDREHCKRLTIVCNVDKSDPRTEIIIKYND